MYIQMYILYNADFVYLSIDYFDCKSTLKYMYIHYIFF